MNGDHKTPDISPYRNIVSGEITKAYWTRQIDGKTVDPSILRSQDGRSLDPGVWIRVKEKGKK